MDLWNVSNKQDQISFYPLIRMVSDRPEVIPILIMVFFTSILAVLCTIYAILDVFLIFYRTCRNAGSEEKAEFDLESKEATKDNIGVAESPTAPRSHKDVDFT